MVRRVRLKVAFQILGLVGLLLAAAGVWAFVDGYLRLNRMTEVERVAGRVTTSAFRFALLTHELLLQRELRSEEQWRKERSELLDYLAEQREVLAPYRQHVAAIEGSLNDLEPLFEALIKWLRSGRGDKGATREERVYLLQASQVTIRIDVLQQTIEEFQSVVRHDFEQTLGTSGRGLFVQLALLFGIFLLFGVAVRWFLAARVSRPIAGLEEGVVRISQGEGELRLTLPEGDELGDVAGAFNATLDREQTEERELLEHRQHLDRLVEGRTVELTRRLGEVEAESHEKSAFLADLAQRLGAPLGTLLDLARGMEREDRLAEGERTNLSTIDRDGRSLLSLLDDLLELSQIELGEAANCPQPVDLHLLLGQIVETVAAEARTKGLGLHLELTPNLPRHLEIDPDKLRRVLGNLLTNAVRFTERGQVVLKVGPSQALTGDDDSRLGLLCEVSDTGPGIAEADLQRIFRPFHPARPGEGNGLGLAICLGYARLLGGGLVVESRPGEGAVFRLRVPAQPVATGAPDPGEDERAAVLAPGQQVRRLLVAEDNPEHLRLLGELLEQAGLQVHAVEDGRQAVEVYRTWQPDCILMDMRMPVMDGYEATRLIRTLPGGDAIPIIALTAAALDEEQQEILAAGCSGILTKPVGREPLLAALTTHLKVEFVSPEGFTEPPPATT